MLALLFLAAPVSAQVAGSPVGKEIERRGAARVIVALRAPVEGARSERRRAIGMAQRRVEAAAGKPDFTILRRFEHVPALAGRVTAAGLARLLASPDVRRIDLDLGGGGDLATSVPQIGADVVREARGFDGSGVTVAVVDSGFDSDHPDLAGALAGEQCFCSGGGGCCPGGGATQSGAGAAEDDEGHGTHVTGILAGRGAAASPGVAPGASVVAVKVLDSNNEFCCVSDVVAGLDWIIANRPEVRAVNMSLGTFDAFFADCDGANASTMALADAIDTLTANGVAVFASSGNDFLPNRMSAPACVHNTISVGAVNDADAVAGFSNDSATLDLLAPGVAIVAAGLGGGTDTKSGTSMAAPHAAGTAALLLDAVPSLSPADLLAVLAATGLAVTDPRTSRVHPRIDAEAALNDVCAGRACARLDPFQCYKVEDLKEPKFAPTSVALNDAFVVNDGDFEVKKPFLLCNPADLNGDPTSVAAGHLTCYKIKGAPLDEAQRPRVEVSSVLGTSRLEAQRPFLLCVPSSKTVLP